MIDIESYMNDGANYQAQAVLAFLRARKGGILQKLYNHGLAYDGYLNVGRFENCREQGYVFMLGDYLHRKNYCVYEHRNSDSLIVLTNESDTLNTPDINIMWNGRDGKYDYDKDFPCNHIEECVDWIEDDMKKTIDLWIEKKNAEISLESENK